MKIQPFIDMRKRTGSLAPGVEEKRKAVVRDWWKMVLWYVRLRKASKKKVYHPDLLNVELKAA